MERLTISQLSTLQSVAASLAGIPESEVDIIQDLEKETLTAKMYGQCYTANCAGDSYRAAVKDFLKCITQEIPL